MKLSEIISILETAAPLAYQEHYDNSGLAFGEPGMEITGALLCIDITMSVVEEAMQSEVNLIISHHPLIFKGIQKLSGSTITEKILIKAIQQNIAIYCAHTNMDNIHSGVNQRICQKLGLINTKILAPLQQALKKIVTYVPHSHAEVVRIAMFEAGAGHIGNYDQCSFNAEGKGSFRAQEGANPFAGKKGEIHFENEVRIETIFPAFKTDDIIKALIQSHPYEEVAYDIYCLDNENGQVGSGMTGELMKPENELDFLQRAKEIFSCSIIRHTRLLNKPLSRVAVCGGSGAFLIPKAISSGAQLFITGEVKYHQFFEAEDKIVIADLGHYESEQFTIELFYDILIKNLPNFAVRFSTIKSSPIYYL